MTEQRTQHFRNWLALVQQVGDDVEREMGYRFIDATEYDRRMNLRLDDLEAPLDIHDYRALYGSEYGEE